MSDVTGPISTLPGTSHSLPKDTRCDDHPDRPAVARIQGETDSFGSEMRDLCAECLEQHRAYLRSPEAEKQLHGQCEWCKVEASDLHNARDYEEGTCGRIYRVCGACVRRQSEEAAAELEEYDDGFDDWDGDDYEEDDHL